MESYSALEGDIRQRSLTDWQTPPGTAIILGIVTCGIYWFYVLYKILERREQHFERMVAFRTHLIEVLKEKAETAGKTAEVEQDISQLEGLNLDATNRDRYGEKSPVLWLVLGIVVSIVIYYVYYFLNDDFLAHQSNENEFMLKASEIMNKLGITENQIVTPMVVPERNFVTYIILTLVTCGIYGIYWMYTVIKDPNDHFDGHAMWEAQVQTILQP